MTGYSSTYRRGFSNKRIARVQRSRRRSPADTTEERPYSLKCFQNRWYDGFFIHHNLTGKDDIPAIEIRRSLGSVEDPLEILLDTNETPAFPCEADEVKKYCRGGPSLEKIQSRTGECGGRRAAWVDDRQCLQLLGKGNVRRRGTWLTATELLKYLRKAV
jgi:hypothetical protein